MMKSGYWLRIGISRPSVKVPLYIGINSRRLRSAPIRQPIRAGFARMSLRTRICSPDQQEFTGHRHPNRSMGVYFRLYAGLGHSRFRNTKSGTTMSNESATPRETTNISDEAVTSSPEGPTEGSLTRYHGFTTDRYQADPATHFAPRIDRRC